MADGVDAAVQHVQPAPVDATLDRPSAHPDRDELRARDDTVLTLRERGDRSVISARPRSTIDVMVKVGLAVHAAHGPDRTVPEHHARVTIQPAGRSAAPTFTENGTVKPSASRHGSSSSA